LILEWGFIQLLAAADGAGDWDTEFYNLNNTLNTIGM